MRATPRPTDRSSPPTAGRHVRRLALLVPLLAAAAVPWGCGREPTGGAAGREPFGDPPTNLVLIVLDTVRADVLGLLPGEAAPPLMPRLARRARSGVAFRQASAPSSWTLASMTSMLTGLRPARHGLDSPVGRMRMAEGLRTYAEILHDDLGVETAAFVAGPWMSAEGNVRGFATLEQGYGLAGTAPLVDAWLAHRDPKRPFFLLLHTFDAHDPYGEANHAWPVPEPAPMSVDELAAFGEPWRITELTLTDRRAHDALVLPGARRYMDMLVQCLNDTARYAPDQAALDRVHGVYDDGVRWCDQQLDQAIEVLAARGLLDHALLVVTSDHGEAFGEHGILGHMRRLDEELVRVPLVAWGPPPFDRPAVVDAPVGVIDVVATWMDLAGLPPVPLTDAASFLDVVRDGAPGRPTQSEARALPSLTGAEGEVIRHAVRDGRIKVVLTHDLIAGTLREEAFDLVADPGERQDLAHGLGVLPSGLVLDPVFCRALEVARDRAWQVATELDARAGTAYAAGTSRVTSGRPAPCDE